jgi:hypothetical protein
MRSSDRRAVASVNCSALMRISSARRLRRPICSRLPFGPRRIGEPFNQLDICRPAHEEHIMNERASVKRGVIQIKAARAID